jgi:hypothetical protein
MKRKTIVKEKDQRELLVIPFGVAVSLFKYHILSAQLKAKKNA